MAITENAAGPGCQDLNASASNQTFVGGVTCTVAGNVHTYRLRVFDDSQTYNIAWSMQTIDTGPPVKFTVVSGTGTG
ncbi:unnamed protein product, partial [marine sediment metagenome]